MKLEDQCCTLHQAKRLKELGLEQISYFVWGENAKVLTEEWSIEGTEDSFYSAFTVAELGIILKGYNTPFYWGLWNEWCFKENGDPRGYGTEASARAEYLIHLIKSNIISIKEINKRLTE